MEQFVGIDVSKKHLEVAVRSGGGNEGFTVTNSVGGIRGLVKRLAPLGPTVVVIEASGGYERAVRAALGMAGVPVHLANPMRTKAFTICAAHSAKTDKVDAASLAEFGEKLRPNPTPAPDPQLEGLQALIVRRQQLVDMRTVEKNHLQVAAPAERAQVAKHIRYLAAEIKGQDRTIKDAIRANSSWRERDRLLRTANGIGPVASAMLIAYLPELGTLPHKKLAALVGVAPFARDSGNKQGKRSIRGGRGRVRSVLYMAALAAIRSDPQIKAFYHRLMQQNKLKKVAIVACMHKLLRTVNGMLRRGMTWDPDWRNTLRSAQIHPTHRNELAGQLNATSQRSASPGSAQPVPTSVPTPTIALANTPEPRTPSDHALIST